MSLYENPTINASTTGIFGQPLARARKASTRWFSPVESPHPHGHRHGHGQPFSEKADETRRFRPPANYDTAPRDHRVHAPLPGRQGSRPDYPNPLRLELLSKRATGLRLAAECVGISMSFRMTYGLWDPAGVALSLIEWWCGCSKQRASWLLHELERRGIIVQAGEIDIPGRASPCAASAGACDDARDRRLRARVRGGADPMKPPASSHAPKQNASRS